MQALSLDDLDRHSAAFDEAVAATPHIDRFCSSSDWIVPAARALMPTDGSFIGRGPDGWAALMRTTHRDGIRLVHAAEMMWGLACPLVGPDPQAMAAALTAWLRRRTDDWEVLLLSGVPENAPLQRHAMRALGAHYHVRTGGPTTRHVASLRGGPDGFLSRRSRNFRKALRSKRRAVRDAGFAFELHTDATPERALALFERALAVERRSWKGRAGVGVDDGRMCAFYRAMVPRLAARGALRMLLVRAPDADRDVAYVLGGVFAGVYRGLQFSFDQDYERYALGNVCQYHQIVALCQEGIEDYDLGTGLDYKRRWAERVDTSVTLIAING